MLAQNFAENTGTNNTVQNSQLLQNIVRSGMMGTNDALEEWLLTLMKSKFLELNHHYAITYNEKEKRWKTYIPDASKRYKRKSVAKRTKEDLENFLYDFYMKQPSNETPSFRQLFFQVLEHKLNLVKSDEKRISTTNTQVKNRSDYKRYFENTTFEKMSISSITKNDIENICLQNLKRYDMKKKAFSSLRGILKCVFDFAYSNYLISENVFLRVDFNQFKNMFIPDTPIRDRVHTDDELDIFLQALHTKQETRPKLSSYWALELQILTGFRRGEIPPLTWNEVSEEGILICKQQLTSNDNIFITVGHTKTYMDRFFPMTDDLKNFLTRLRAMNDKYYPDSIYLFPNQKDNNTPITNRAVYSVYHNICKKYNLSKVGLIKGPHSFRRNMSTFLYKASNGNLSLSTSLLGHHACVAEKNYITDTCLSNAQEIVNQRHLLE